MNKIQLMEAAIGPSYAHRLLDAFRRFADQPALKWKADDQWLQVTYAELGDQVLNLAAALVKAGIHPRDRVAIYLETSRAWVLMDFALQLIGAVTTTVYPTLPPAQAKQMLDDAEVVGILANAQQLEALRSQACIPSSCVLTIAADGENSESFESLLRRGHDIRSQDATLRVQLESPAVDPEDLSAIIYTSGTTGEPKGAMLTHANILSNADAGIECFASRETYINLVHLPLAHIVARNTVIACSVLTGDLMVIAEPDRSKWAVNFKEIAPTAMVTVPYLLDKFRQAVMEQVSQQNKWKQLLTRWALKVGHRCRVKPVMQGGPVKQQMSPLLQFLDKIVLSKIRAGFGGRLRVIVTGAANIELTTLQFFWAIGIEVYEAYGMTEVTTSASFTWRGDVKVGTVGKAAPRMSIRLADDGEVLVKGPSVMKGYWRKPELTREVIDAEAWLHTGDIGVIDQAGYLSIVDRKKDIFVLDTGKNVAPQAIENALKRSACIENVCVVGDKRRYITALIVPNLMVAQQRLELSEPLQASDPSLKKLLDAEIAKHSYDLAGFERVKDYAVLEETFSTENELLTPTLKLRRKNILKKYSDVIQNLYEGAAT